MNTTNILLIPLLPFISFLVLGLAGRKIFGKYAGTVGTFLMLASFILSVIVATDYFGHKTGDAYQQVIAFKYNWLSFANGLNIEMGALIDPVAVMMLLVVTFISLMVHIFSLAYMKGEDRFHIYYAFLGLFTSRCWGWCCHPIFSRSISSGNWWASRHSC